MLFFVSVYARIYVHSTHVEKLCLCVCVCVYASYVYMYVIMTRTYVGKICLLACIYAHGRFGHYVRTFADTVECVLYR